MLLIACVDSEGCYHTLFGYPSSSCRECWL